MVTVLIVEDEFVAAKHCAQCITEISGDYSIIGICRNREEVLAAYEKVVPDIIFSDIRLGRDDGIEVIEELRAKGWQGKLVIMSVYGNFNFAKRAIHAGVEEYLLKPIFKDDVASVLNRISESTNGNLESNVVSQLIKGDINVMPKYIRKTVEYICMHYKEPISLAQLAEYSSISGTYLSSEFSKHTGYTLVTFLNLFRLQISKHYLLNTDHPLEVIALEVGFSDVTYYSRLFKRFFEESPGKYRKHEE